MMWVALFIIIVGAELVNILAMHKLEQRIDMLELRVCAIEAKRRARRADGGMR